MDDNDRAAWQRIADERLAEGREQWQRRRNARRAQQAWHAERRRHGLEARHRRKLADIERRLSGLVPPDGALTPERAAQLAPAIEAAQLTEAITDETIKP